MNKLPHRLETWTGALWVHVTALMLGLASVFVLIGRRGNPPPASISIKIMFIPGSVVLHNGRINIHFTAFAL